MTVAGITFAFSRRDPSEVLISARVASPCQSQFDNLGGHRVAEVDMPASQNSGSGVAFPGHKPGEQGSPEP